jgi:3-deoxy-D-manno-octulosonic acid kinase
VPSTEARIVADGRHIMLFDARLEEPASVAWFDPDSWRRAGATALETSGRGQVLIVPRETDTWVLRHYHRGGFVARFVADHYLWLGLERTRAFREWRLLRSLRDAGLPVPNPVAAHVYRSGSIYAADIITSYLADTQKWSWYLRQGGAPQECWREIGRVVRAIHDRGVDHPDLTAHNILVDSRRAVFVVDFDNARFKPPGRWRQAGLARLNRSLRKVALETGTDYDPAAWAELVSGYEGTVAG